MAACKDDATVQEVGNKMIQRIDNTLEEEMLALEKEKEEAVEKAKMRMIAEDTKELEAIQGKLNEQMATEAAKMDEQLGKRREQILGLKRQNLEERLKVVAGEMSDIQIKELRAQFDREYAQLGKTIDEEKAKQLASMRSAMLNRRIAKERKRKQEDEATKAAARRKRVAQMNAGMAKAFRKLIKEKAEAENVAVADAEGLRARQDRLRARLAAWERGVKGAHAERGGEDGEIWNLEAAREAEKEEKARLIREAEEARLRKETEINNTIEELYKRILKIEDLSSRIKDSGIMAVGARQAADDGASTNRAASRGISAMGGLRGLDSQSTVPKF